MTVAAEISKIIYDGTGSQIEFPYTFRILDSSHLGVVLTDSGGTETVWTLNTEYVVTDVGENEGGNVVVQTDDVDYTPQLNEKLTLYRTVPLTQETDYVENDPFHAETHETTIDKLTMIDQQTQEELDRSLKYPVSDSTTATEMPAIADRTNKFFAWDEWGNPSAKEETTIVDHGDCSGLLDDDHPQYHNDARGDIRYYQKSEVYIVSSESFTLDATDIINKYIDLTHTPTSNDSILLVVEHGIKGILDTDYSVSVKRISWNGKDYDGTLESGDILSVMYWY